MIAENLHILRQQIGFFGKRHHVLEILMQPKIHKLKEWSCVLSLDMIEIL